MRKTGIRNISGVSCHLNAAIQLLFHALSSDSVLYWIQLTHELSELQEETPVPGHLQLRTNDKQGEQLINKANSFVYRFGSLLEQYFQLNSDGSFESAPTTESINPLEFYNQISQLKLHADDIGDAGTAFTILLDTLRKSLDTIILVGEPKLQNLASSLLDELTNDFWRGPKIIHQVRGIQYKVVDNSIVNGKIHSWVKKITISRPKQERVLPCPWILPTRHESKSFSSLHASLQYSLSEQSIRGYDWNIQQDCNFISESIIDVTDDSDDDDDSSNDSSDSSSREEATTDTTSNFKTCKYSELDPNTLPRNILVWLKRFEFKDHHVHIVSDSMDIPRILDLKSFISSSGDVMELSNMLIDYRLKGAIVYVNDNAENRNNPEDIDVGHYVTYLNLSASQWVLVDDEKIVPLHHVEEDRIIHLLSGRLCKLASDSDLVSAGFATVLLYEQSTC